MHQRISKNNSKDEDENAEPLYILCNQPSNHPTPTRNGKTFIPFSAIVLKTSTHIQHHYYLQFGCYTAV